MHSPVQVTLTDFLSNWSPDPHLLWPSYIKQWWMRRLCLFAPRFDLSQLLICGSACFKRARKVCSQTRLFLISSLSVCWAIKRKEWCDKLGFSVVFVTIFVLNYFVFGSLFCPVVFSLYYFKQSVSALQHATPTSPVPGSIRLSCSHIILLFLTSPVELFVLLCSQGGCWRLCISCSWPWTEFRILQMMD